MLYWGLRACQPLQVLFKMLNGGLFSEINGCISTGKEANVYHARTAQGRDLAVKVYKTSILGFKDRDRSVSVLYCSSNAGKQQHNCLPMISG